MSSKCPTVDPELSLSKDGLSEGLRGSTGSPPTDSETLCNHPAGGMKRSEIRKKENSRESGNPEPHHHTRTLGIMLLPALDSRFHANSQGSIGLCKFKLPVFPVSIYFYGILGKF